MKCYTLHRFIKLPLEVDNIKLSYLTPALITSWLMIIVIVWFATTSSMELADTISMTQQPANNNKVQILGPNNEQELLRSLPYMTFKHIDYYEVYIHFNSIYELGTCLIGNQIIWEAVLDLRMVFFDDQKVAMWQGNSDCYCSQEIYNCSMSSIVRFEQASNWNLLDNNSSRFVYNVDPNWLRTINGIGDLRLDKLGISMENQYVVNGGNTYGSHISTHAVTLGFSAVLHDLLANDMSSLIGMVTTIDIISPTLTTRVAHWLALSFGLFGSISIIIKILFYRTSLIEQ